jgi:hypothetical protein
MENTAARDAIRKVMKKQAGGTGWPLTSKPISVGPRRIKKVCYDAGGWADGYLESMDWRKIKFDKPKPNPYRSTGTLVYWSVYPQGQYGDNASDYIYGYVMTEWTSTPKGVVIKGDVVVKH